MSEKKIKRNFKTGCAKCGHPETRHTGPMGLSICDVDAKEMGNETGCPCQKFRTKLRPHEKPYTD